MPSSGRAQLSGGSFPNAARLKAAARAVTFSAPAPFPPFDPEAAFASARLNKAELANSSGVMPPNSDAVFEEPAPDGVPSGRGSSSNLGPRRPGVHAGARGADLGDGGLRLCGQRARQRSHPGRQILLALADEEGQPLVQCRLGRGVGRTVCVAKRLGRGNGVLDVRERVGLDAADRATLGVWKQRAVWLRRHVRRCGLHGRRGRGDIGRLARSGRERVGGLQSKVVEAAPGRRRRSGIGQGPPCGCRTTASCSGRGWTGLCRSGRRRPEAAHRNSK